MTVALQNQSHSAPLTSPTQAASAPLGNSIPLGPPAHASPNQAAPTPSVPNMAKRKAKFLSGIASNIHQVVGLAIDRSSSMFGQGKINEVNKAGPALIRELALPENKDAFEVFVVGFHHDSEIVVDPELATETIWEDLQPDGGTDFEKAIDSLLEGFALAASNAMDGMAYVRPHALFLSDGQSYASDAKIAELHAVADVTAVAFGADADQAMLRRIASDGIVHRISSNGGELRSFLAGLGKTLSQELIQSS